MLRAVKPYHLVLILLIVIFLIISKVTLLKLPPVWPDEPLVADIALNILHENRPGTDLYKGYYDGVEKYGIGYPPILFYTTAFVFKIFGFSVLNSRLPALLIGVLTILIFYKLIQHFIREEGKASNQISAWIPIIALVPLIINQAFLIASHINRPEIFVLFYGTFGSYLALRGLQKNTSKRSERLLGVSSGLLVSLAFLSHYGGIIFLLSILLYAIWSKRLSLFKSDYFYFFIISFLIPVAFWVISLLPSLNYFLMITDLGKQAKNISPNFLHEIFLSQAIDQKILFLIYFLIAWELITFSFIDKKHQYILLSFLLIFSWIFAYSWKHTFIYIYPTVFTYPALSVLCFESIKQYLNKRNLVSKLKLYIYSGIFLVILALNSFILLDELKTKQGNNYSYELFTKKVLKIIPDNKTVFIMSIPDPYFGFRQRRNNILYQSPTIKTDKQKYLNILSKSDFIVYNTLIEAPEFNNFLPWYIEKNSKNVTYLQEPLQYQAVVVELKPKAERVEY